MKNSKYLPRTLSVLVISIFLSGAASVAQAASYMYTGRSTTLQVKTGEDNWGRPIWRTLDLRNGSYYSEDTISKLSSSFRMDFAGYGAAPAPAPTDFDDRKTYQYTGRDRPIEVVVGKDRFGRDIKRTLDLRNGSFYSGETIKKLGSSMRSSFVLRAIAPAALVTSLLGLAPGSAEASKVRVNSGSGSGAIGIDGSNAGIPGGDLESELLSSSNSSNSKARSTAR